MDTMTPSAVQPITDGQIDKTVDTFRAILQKHRNDFNSGAVQQALGTKELSVGLLGAFRNCVEMFSGLIIRHTLVDRTRTAQQALDATGRSKYLNDAVVVAMPQGEKAEEDVVFFKPDKSAYDKNGLISDDEVDKQYELRGLKPVDPYALAAVNEADPAFADEHPNGTHWKDADGKCCCLTFSRWGGERGVFCARRGSGWYDPWWFAGVRK